MAKLEVGGQHEVKLTTREKLELEAISSSLRIPVDVVEGVYPQLCSLIIDGDTIFQAQYNPGDGSLEVTGKLSEQWQIDLFQRYLDELKHQPSHELRNTK